MKNKSEASKISALERRLQEVESALGRKQLELDLLNKRVSIAGKELGVDKKKVSQRSPSTVPSNARHNPPP